MVWLGLKRGRLSSAQCVSCNARKIASFHLRAGRGGEELNPISDQEFNRFLFWAAFSPPSQSPYIHFQCGLYYQNCFGLKKSHLKSPITFFKAATLVKVS